MNMELSRRQLIKGASAGLAGTTIGALGFGDVETAYAAAIRPFKLAGTTETVRYLAGNLLFPLRAATDLPQTLAALAPQLPERGGAWRTLPLCSGIPVCS